MSINSIYLSEGKLPETFVKGTGAPETFIEYMHALVNNPIEYYTCFISYSNLDQDLAGRLFNDLQGKGVRCWYAPHNMRPGDLIRRTIDESIRIYDKLLLLSRRSVESDWVGFEVEVALEKERQQNQQALFPIRIDETVFTTNQAWAKDIRRRRHIGDFTGWKDHDTYQKSLQRLLRNLQAKDKIIKSE